MTLGFKLRKPCANCPFRTDRPFYLHRDRAAEIAQALQGGSTFTCHKTTIDAPEADWDDAGGDRIDGPNAQMCAGALVVMEREDAPNQMMRIAERLGMYDRRKLDMAAPVPDSLAAWVRGFGGPTVTDEVGQVLDFEHCGIVAGDCEDPAGYSGTGENLDPPTCNPLTDGCSWCGQMMCPACRAADDEDGHPRCVYCAEES